MSETKHTPGPWEIDHIDEKDGEIFISTPGIQWAICSLMCDPLNDETRANARLIAAAPELLAELQRCRITFEQIKESYEPDNSEYGIAQATINEIDKVLEKTGLPNFL